MARRRIASFGMSMSASGSTTTPARRGPTRARSPRRPGAKPLGVEDRAVDVADHDALDARAVRADEVGDLLRLIGVPAGVHVDRGAGLGLGHERGPHDLPFLVGPRGLAADLADDARADAGAPRAVPHRGDDLGGEVVHAARALPGSW